MNKRLLAASPIFPHQPLMMVIFIFLVNFLSIAPCVSTQNVNSSLHESFVHIDEIIPSIHISARYAKCDNFTGRPVEGYPTERLALTRPAAEALEKAQEDFRKDGYLIVVYDAYRPQKAVNTFIKWSEDINDQEMKASYYPRVNKAEVFEKGYVAKKSGHSRGSTVDMTIIPTGQVLHEVRSVKRTLKDGFEFLFLDDGTVDMGSSFDLFDVASHSDSKLVSDAQFEKRQYLKKIMEKNGFENYDKEWWHFTLYNEPFKDEYFDFIVR